MCQRMMAGGQITALLKRQRAGDREAFDQLVSMVYDHLRRVARGQLARGWPSETLSATALVHEAYLQLRHETRVDWQGREHFFAIAARAMRRILVDHARYRRAQKRAQAAAKSPFDRGRSISPSIPKPIACSPIDEAMSALEQSQRAHRADRRVPLLRRHDRRRNRRRARHVAAHRPARMDARPRVAGENARRRSVTDRGTGMIEEPV